MYNIKKYQDIYDYLLENNINNDLIINSLRNWNELLSILTTKLNHWSNMQKIVFSNGILKYFIVFF